MENKLISATAVRDLCGGISDTTLWRWLNNSELDFPRPIHISKRRYWREVELTAWLARQGHAQQEVA